MYVSSLMPRHYQIARNQKEKTLKMFQKNKLSQLQHKLPQITSKSFEVDFSAQECNLKEAQVL